VQPASVETLRAVATGEIPIAVGDEGEDDYTPSSSARRTSTPSG
jgi:hypothetical protein